MINFTSILVPIISVGFGYLFFRIVKPKIKSGTKEVYYARLFLAWSLFVSTSFYIQPFASGPSMQALSFWAIRSIPFAIVASIAGYLYGKFSK
jgi:hypothetical protein